MTRTEFAKYATGRIFEELTDLAKYLGRMRIESELGSSIKAPIVRNDQNDPQVSKSLINHFEKLICDLRNTSNKSLLCCGERFKPIDQQFEVYKAINAFLAVAITRDKHGIRNAYVSFTRQRKQKLVRSQDNPDGARRGRPNLYETEQYRFVVNRAAKLKKAKKAKRN